jgi:hypothetical protein
MPEQSPHHDDAFGAACVVRIDAHGSKDRVKDVSAERMRRSLVRASVHTLGRMRDVVPLLGVLRTSAVIGASSVAGGTRYGETDRPRPSFRRRPAKRAAFQKARMSSTATTREGVIAEGLLPPALTPALSLTPPTPCPEGRCF